MSDCVSVYWRCLMKCFLVPRDWHYTHLATSNSLRIISILRCHLHTTYTWKQRISLRRWHCELGDDEFILLSAITVAHDSRGHMHIQCIMLFKHCYPILGANLLDFLCQNSTWSIINNLMCICNVIWILAQATLISWSNLTWRSRYVIWWIRMHNYGSPYRTAGFILVSNNPYVMPTLIVSSMLDVV